MYEVSSREISSVGTGSLKSWFRTTKSNLTKNRLGIFAQLGIKNHYFSPAHPQTNRQVEVTNRSLLKIIKTRLEGAKGIGQMNCQVYCGWWETPFRLAYGSDAVIPTEVGLTSYKVENHDESRNDKAMLLQLNLVDKVRETAKQRLAQYQDLMTKHYNSRVRHRDFQVRDLILRKVTGVTRDPSQGKLGLNWEGPYRITSWTDTSQGVPWNLY